MNGPAPERPVERLRFGLVGCGSIGPTHAAAVRQLSDVADLVAVADLNADRVAKVAKDYAVAKAYASDEELLADPAVDAVIFATPSGLHAQQAVRAMHAGKHVVVEKPMDVSLAACDRMIAAERETGKKLAVISQHRFDPASVFVRDAVNSGRLGRLILVEMSVKWWRTQQYYDSGDWRGTWAMDGGGALMNQGVHTVDVMQWIAGPVTSVFARTATAGHERIEVEDVAIATLKFASGAIGTLTATTAAYDGQPARVDVYGTEGSAVIEGDRLKFFKLKDGTTATEEQASRHALSVASGGTASVKDETATRLTAAADKNPANDPGGVWGDAHREQLRDFVHAVRTDGRPLIQGVEGRKPLEIILAVYASAKAGHEVTL